MRSYSASAIWVHYECAMDTYCAQKQALSVELKSTPCMQRTSANARRVHRRARRARRVLGGCPPVHCPWRMYAADKCTPRLSADVRRLLWCARGLSAADKCPRRMPEHARVDKCPPFECPLPNFLNFPRILQMSAADSRCFWRTG